MKENLSMRATPHKAAMKGKRCSTHKDPSEEVVIWLSFIKPCVERINTTDQKTALCADFR